MTLDDAPLLPETPAWISAEEALAICGLDLDELAVLVERELRALAARGS